MATRTNFCACVFLHLFFVLPTAQAQNSTSESTTKFEFDCRRSSVSCGKGNDCNLTSGTCVCNDNGTDYMCGQSGSNCLEEDKYGNDCKFNRVQVLCSLTGMLVNVNPHGSFQGVISVYSKSDVDGCTFVNISNLNASEDVYQPDDYKKWEGYGIVINHTSGICGNATYSAVGQEESYTRTFIVRYSQYFVSAIDQIITTKCTSKTGNLTVYGSIPSVMNQEQLGIKNITVDDEVDAVTFKIAREDGEPLKNGSSVVLGDKIELRFEGVQGFRLNKCVANNTINKTADFVTNYCPDERAKSLFYDNILAVNENGKFQIILRLKAFRFTGNTAVAFVCNVVLCGKNCSEINCPGYSPAVTKTAPTVALAPTTPASVINPGNSSEVSNTTESPPTTTAAAAASNSSSSSRRRRRAAENSKIVSTSLQVLDSRDQLPTDTPSISTKAESSECQEDRSLLVLVILLAVFVVILLSCIGVLVSRTLKTKSAAKTHKNDTRYAEPVPTMRIPRLELNTTRVNQPC